MVNIDKIRRRRYIVIKTMQSTSKHLAITFSVKKGLRLVSTENGKFVAKIEKNPELAIYTNTPVVNDSNVLAPTPQMDPATLTVEASTLNDIKGKVSPNTYLNFESYEAKDLWNTRMLLNKIIIDRKLEFSPALDDIRVVYFNVVSVQRNVVSIGVFDVRTDKITTVTIGCVSKETQGVSRVGVSNRTDLVQAFVDMLAEMSQESLVVAIGFNCSVDDGKSDAHRSELVTLLHEIECSDYSFKYGVSTAEYKSGR